MSNPQIVSLPAVVQVGSYIINDYLIEITESSDGNGYTMSITRGGQTQDIHLTELKQEYVDECIQTALAEAKASGEFDGVTPIANVIKENGVATITITDAEGTTEAEIFDGVTPVAAVVKNNGVAKVTITDDNGTTEADIYDGVSPKITSSKSNNVAHVSIEDAYGTSEFDLYDGEKGDKGDTGETGNGIADATLNEDYTLTLDYTNGDSFTTPVSIRGERGPQGVQGVQGPRGLQGLRGETGPQGPKGDTGATPALTIGTVTTLDPSEDATTTISGTPEAPVLNLGIPQGIKGDTGEISEEEFEAVIAPGFDASTAYVAGSYVLKNGVLYRFIADHSAGAWTGSDAETVTVGGEVGELNNIAHQLTESSALTFNNAYLYKAIIGESTGAWYENGTVYYGYILPVPENAVRITVTANENQYAVFAPLKTSAHEIGTVPDYIDGPNGKRMIISAGETYSFAVSGCNYLWVLQKDQTNVDPTPESITVTALKDIVYANDLDNELIETEVFGLSDININKYASKQIAISTSNRWSTSGSSFFIPVSDFFGTYLLVTSHATNGSVICFLISNEYTNNTTARYANGTSRYFVPAGETREFEIPSDCTYINVLNYWSNDFVPQSFKAYLSTVSKIKDEILTDDRIGLTWDYWYPSNAINSHFYLSWSPYTSKQGKTTSASNTLKASSFIPLYGKMLELPMMWAVDSTYVTYGMSLYDKDKNPIPGRAISAMAMRGENDPRYCWVRVYIPENAKYFRTTYWADDSPAITEGLAPTFSYNLLKEIPDEYKPITHELPVDTYMQNTIRRARQLTDIKWTPRVNIPRYSMMDGSDVHFLDWFYADHEYTGIPYSGAGKREGSSSGWTAPEEWGYAHNWVGGCIPFEAFVTAARYPNSIFSETTGQSAPDYDSSPFGIVCTGLVNYSVNGPWPLRGINNFFSTSDDAFVSTRKTVETFDDFMIGDFLYTAPHVIIITDIRRDKDGNITHVEMSEATTVGNGNNAILGSKLGGVARRKMWAYEEFKTRYYAYTVFRRKTFYGIPYYPSKYVDTGNEGDQKNIVDYPCIPYLGNGAIYREGYIHNSKILIGATGFTSLVVTKDGAEFGTFDVTGLTEIEVGFSTVGRYEAYLTNGTSRTRACTWTVETGTM